MRLILFFSLMFAVSAARAADIALMLAGSVRSNTATTDLSNGSVGNRLSFGGGILGVAPINGAFVFRSGFLFTQRFIEIAPTNVGITDVNFGYIDVPLTPMYLVTNELGLFAGPVIAMNMTKDCSASSGSCGASNVKSVVVPLTVGLQARLFNQIGAELFYESTMGSLADHISNLTTVGANILFYFD